MFSPALTTRCSFKSNVSISNIRWQDQTLDFYTGRTQEKLYFIKVMKSRKELGNILIAKTFVFLTPFRQSSTSTAGQNFFHMLGQ